MFGMNINYKCMQKIDPEDRDACQGGAACKKCGWNIDVYNKRVKQLAEEGLTLCEDGLRRLVIK